MGKVTRCRPRWSRGVWHFDPVRAGRRFQRRQDVEDSRSRLDVEQKSRPGPLCSRNLDPHSITVNVNALNEKSRCLLAILDHSAVEKVEPKVRQRRFRFHRSSPLTHLHMRCQLWAIARTGLLHVAVGIVSKKCVSSRRSPAPFEDKARGLRHGFRRLPSCSTVSRSSRLRSL
jgi:hypothetical protein